VERFVDRLPMPAAYFELALRQFGTTQFLRGELLSGTGVSAAQLAEPGAEITLGQQLQQVRNVNRLAPAGWALGIGRSFHASTHGPLGFAAVSAATLGEGLDLVARFLHVRNPSHRGEGSIAGSEYRLTLVEQAALLEEERIPVAETILLSLQALIEAVLAGPLTEGRFELGYAEPPWAYRYRECFHAEVRFGAERSAIVLPAHLGAARSPFADPGVWASALPALEAQARRVDGLDFTAARVEQLLQQAGDAPAPLADVARRLGMSRRTLTRRLQEAGVGYRDLADRHRRRRAEALLREGGWSVAEIGYRLGYEDAANFARACRRWFGAAPSALRRGRGAPG
jgi:AraC-like DNA-binding protein